MIKDYMEVVDKDGYVYICSRLSEDKWIMTSTQTMKTYQIKECDFKILGLKEIENAKN